jgi:hypothetical protein
MQGPWKCVVIQDILRSILPPPLLSSSPHIPQQMHVLQSECLSALRHPLKNAKLPRSPFNGFAAPGPQHGTQQACPPRHAHGKIGGDGCPLVYLALYSLPSLFIVSRRFSGLSLSTRIFLVSGSFVFRLTRPTSWFLISHFFPQSALRSTTSLIFSLFYFLRFFVYHRIISSLVVLYSYCFFLPIPNFDTYFPEPIGGTDLGISRF